MNSFSLVIHITLFVLGVRKFDQQFKMGYKMHQEVEKLL